MLERAAQPEHRDVVLLGHDDAVDALSHDVGVRLLNRRVEAIRHDEALTPSAVVRGQFALELGVGQELLRFERWPRANHRFPLPR